VSLNPDIYLPADAGLWRGYSHVYTRAGALLNSGTYVCVMYVQNTVDSLGKSQRSQRLHKKNFSFKTIVRKEMKK